MAKQHNPTKIAAPPPIELPPRYNYIAAFLTLACNLRCSYCINWFSGPGSKHKLISGADWVRGLNRLVPRPDLPVTLQGGEPSLHPDFYEIIRGLRQDLQIDVLTNLQLDMDRFIAEVPPERIRRDAPYASIRVSYHPQVMDFQDLKSRVLRLLDKGYSVGVWAVEHPSQLDRIEQAKAECQQAGIDFRTKEFLGTHDGELYGTYRYPEAVAGDIGPKVQCRTSELLIGPSGDVYRCHSDLYESRTSVGHILEESFRIEDVYRPCTCYGRCNPCDVKVKTNRFQEFGHTSVDIKIGEN